jgi:hypothetical protein
MKKVTWFVAGAVSGVSAARMAKRKVRQKVQNMSPDHVIKQAVSNARVAANEVVEAMRDGRLAMLAKEIELRARRDKKEPSFPDAIDANEVSHIDSWRQRRRG